MQNSCNDGRWTRPSIVYYTYVEKNKSSRERAHKLQFNTNTFPIKTISSTSVYTTTSNTIEYPTMEVDVHIPATAIPQHH